MHYFNLSSDPGVVTRRLRSFFKRPFAGESLEGVIYKDRIPEPKINHFQVLKHGA